MADGSKTGCLTTFPSCCTLRPYGTEQTLTRRRSSLLVLHLSWKFLSVHLSTLRLGRSKIYCVNSCPIQNKELQQLCGLISASVDVPLDSNNSRERIVLRVFTDDVPFIRQEPGGTRSSSLIYAGA